MCVRSCRSLARVLASSYPGRSTLSGVACLVAFLALTISAGGFQLITAEEAALPAGAFPTVHLRGSPTRRPSVTIVRPPPNAGLVHSPLELKLRFRAFGGAEIDPDTVVITYLKQPAIDITQRIMPFIKADGIDVANAEVPPGLHQFWVELKDKDGRVGGAEFEFQVAK